MRLYKLICVSMGLIASAATFAQAEPAQNCADFSLAEQATVKLIADGDSLTLTDGRRIRLIGLNAPELHPEPQPHAGAAHSRLRELIESQGNRVRLTTGPEPFDRHGRHLAHVATEDGRVLAAVLINEGLAVQTSVAPNTRCAVHYRRLEQAAREARRGLWQNDDFWRVSFRRLSAKERGFRFIQDRVNEVRAKSWGAQLVLKHGVIVDVDASIALLDAAGHKLAIKDLHNQGIEVRGWLFRYRKQHHLKLHHAANFRLLSP